MEIGYTPVQVDVSTLLPLPLFSAVRAGFASPAEDYLLKRIDLNDELIKHPQATFMVRIKGDSMRDFGIFNDDVVVVDRAIRPGNGQIVIAVIDGEFTCKEFSIVNGLRLRAGNPDYPDIVPTDGQTVEIWGVVRATIKQFKC